MYTPPHFEEVRESEILKIIENFPLATLVCTKDSDLIINHIPLIRLSSTTYLGHIAKTNPLHSLFPAGVDATAVFQLRTLMYRQTGIHRKRCLIGTYRLGTIKLCI